MAQNMANETSALRGEPQPSQVPEHVAEDDYKSFSAALGASARGRAFLHEYARRNRHADTEVVLAALDRLESVARSQKTAPEAERIRQDLRALLDTIRSARPQIDQTPGAIKAATLSALIEFVQARIEGLVQPNNAPLASVPEPEQPELPIPQPGTAFQRTIALVEAIAPPPEPVPQSLPQSLSQSLATPREPQGFVLRLDPRVAPASRNFDPEAMLSELPRSTKIIPEVNFIDSLFSAIDAKNKAGKKAESTAENTPAAPTETIVAAAPVVALLPIETPAVTAAKLPIDMPGPVAATPAAIIEDTADSTAVATAESVTRSDATAAKINASAAAIDEIVAAAQLAMADAAMTETAHVEATVTDLAVADTAHAENSAIEAVVIEEAAIEFGFVETAFGEAAFAEAAAAETEFAEAVFVEATFPEATFPDVKPAEAASPETAIAEPVIAEAVPQALAVDTTPVEAAPIAMAPIMAPIVAPATDPSILAMDNALAEIMALSEEERLALFT